MAAGFPRQLFAHKGADQGRDIAVCYETGNWNKLEYLMEYSVPELDWKACRCCMLRLHSHGGRIPAPAFRT